MEAGMDDINQLCSDLGYESEGFKYGSSFERFMQDNPGCMHVIIDWIRDQVCDVKEWQDNLKDNLSSLSDETPDED